MVFTHIPSNVFLLLMALAPSPFFAGVLYLARQALSRMDVPTRQSYLMAVVDPEERAGAAGITNVVRIIAQTPSPAIAGALMQAVALAAPLLVAAPIKIAYDLALWRSFKDLKPPEEIRVNPS
jgi:predicted MFS family arabinose efflux permease